MTALFELRVVPFFVLAAIITLWFGYSLSVYACRLLTRNMRSFDATLYDWKDDADLVS